MIWAGALALGVVASAAAVAAQTTRPAVDHLSSQPSTLDAGPRAAYLQFLEAVDRGDGPVVRASLYAANGSEQEVVDAMANWVQSYGRLRQALMRAFGPDARSVLADPTRSHQAIAQAQNATEQIGSQRATVQVPDGGPTITLCRVDGSWKIPLADVVREHQYGPQEIAQSVAEYTREAHTMDEIRDQISAERYHTAEEAMQALRTRLIRPATEPTFESPATQDSSAPTSQP
jgi:hypothetical protein